MNGRWKAIVGVNLGLGILLWFGYCSDYSWRGTIPDYVYPLIVAVVAVVSLLLKDKGPNTGARRSYKAACMPSLVGGGAVGVLMVIMMIPPFTLGLLFALAEFEGESMIQSTVSPNGMQVAEVYFRPTGAYSGGNGRVDVRVHYRWMPIAERDVYYCGRSYASDKPQEYLRWRDADTLEIVGDSTGNDEVKLGILKWTEPMIIVGPINIVRSFFGSGGR